MHPMRGSIRRECLDHVIVFDEASLRHTLRSYFRYYHAARLHLSLDKDSPDPRPIESYWGYSRDSSSRRAAPSVRTSRRIVTALFYFLQWRKISVFEIALIELSYPREKQLIGQQQCEAQIRTSDAFAHRQRLLLVTDAIFSREEDDADVEDTSCVRLTDPLLRSY